EDPAGELGQARVDAGVDDRHLHGRQARRRRRPRVEGVVVDEEPLLRRERIRRGKRGRGGGGGERRQKHQQEDAPHQPPRHQPPTTSGAENPGQKPWRGVTTARYAAPGTIGVATAKPPAPSTTPWPTTVHETAAPSRSIRTGAPGRT